MNWLDDISAAAQLFRSRCADATPDIAIVLGSGLARLPAEFRHELTIDMDDLPGFPPVSVEGHQPRISFGRLWNQKTLIFHGRYHVYEGYDAWQVTAPVRLAATLGCRRLLLTNAAGGIDPAMAPGDFMLVTDHLNLTGLNPLVGRSERAFVDMSDTYCCRFYTELAEAVENFGIQLHRGVLAWMIGPSYETPAEINFLEKAGASAVSMSTIPEAIVARRFGLEVCAVSLIANPAAGRGIKALNHADVLSLGTTRQDLFLLLLKQLFQLWK